MGKLEQKKKLNNGGFSLVELIIVIAIMVVLVGVLAPTYLKYVEKSRVSADAATLDEYFSAMQAVASDVDVTTLVTTTEYKVTSAAGSADITVDTALQAVLTTDSGIMTATDVTGKKLQSSQYKAADISIVLKYDSTHSVWNVTKSGF